jgi:transposase
VEKQEEYLNKISNIPKEDMVYIDESGIEMGITKDRGWSKRGKKISCKRSGKRYERINIVAALVNNKSIAPMTFYGSCNTNLFNEWIEKFLLKELKPKQILVMDNASFHKSSKTVKLIEEAGCRIIFLPPYSPEFNPIEKFWANMKRWLKNNITEIKQLNELIDQFFRTC